MPSDAFKSLIKLVDRYGDTCRQMGYYAAALMVPFPSKEHSKQLSMLKQERQDLHNQIDLMLGEEIDRQVAIANQSSFNCLNAALAGIELVKKYT